MEALLLSLLTVGLAEIGDRSQIMVLLLAARFRRPLPVFGGLLAASVLGHGVSAAIGVSLGHLIDPQIVHWLVAGILIIMGAWLLLHPGIQVRHRPAPRSGLGAFGTSFIAITLMELGDKSQLATLALSAHFGTWLPVATGAVLAVMLINAPVVWLGHRFGRNLPLNAIRVIAGIVLILLGSWIGLN